MSYFNCQEKDAISVYLEYIEKETEKNTKEIESNLKVYREIILKQKK